MSVYRFIIPFDTSMSKLEMALHDLKEHDIESYDHPLYAENTVRVVYRPDITQIEAFKAYLPIRKSEQISEHHAYMHGTYYLYFTFIDVPTNIDFNQAKQIVRESYQQILNHPSSQWGMYVRHFYGIMTGQFQDEL